MEALDPGAGKFAHLPKAGREDQRSSVVSRESQKINELHPRRMI
jgi:hypothetical protein